MSEKRGTIRREVPFLILESLLDAKSPLTATQIVQNIYDLRGVELTLDTVKRVIESLPDDLCLMINIEVDISSKYSSELKRVLTTYSASYYESIDAENDSDTDLDDSESINNEQHLTEALNDARKNAFAFGLKYGMLFNDLSLDFKEIESILYDEYERQGFPDELIPEKTVFLSEEEILHGVPESERKIRSSDGQKSIWGEEFDYDESDKAQIYDSIKEEIELRIRDYISGGRRTKAEIEEYKTQLYKEIISRQNRRREILSQLIK